MTSAIVLLSGGLDSTTALYLAKNNHPECYAMSFRYGQRHAAELIMATKTATKVLPPNHHIIMDISLGKLGGSALTDMGIDVPVDRDLATMGQDIPVTYVPARNTVFLAFALAWAEVLDARDIYIGVNALDYSGYVDCRPEFVQAFQDLTRYATTRGVDYALSNQENVDGPYYRINAPLVNLSKVEIIKTGLDLGVDYSMTSSCYNPAIVNEVVTACGRCDSCVLRHAGFVEIGVDDPTIYAQGVLSN